MYRELSYRDISFADVEQSVKLKDIPFGMVFKRKADASKVYIRTNFVRDDGLNKYSCIDYDDSCREIFLKGDTVVYVGFEM